MSAHRRLCTSPSRPRCEWVRCYSALFRRGQVCRRKWRMSGHDIEAIAAAYVRFADTEARDRSPLYESFARAVAQDPELLLRLSRLPPHKRQPNLLLASVRHVTGLAAD